MVLPSGNITYTCNDYYPFGSLMPGRNANAPNYRYGFNGMEKDDEVKGTGNSYTTEFRQYDPRLGRWLSIDPLASLFPSESNYVGFANNPIFWKDPSGMSPTNGPTPTKTIKHEGGYSSAHQEHIKSGLPNNNVEDGARIVHTYANVAAGDIKSLIYTYSAESGEWTETTILAEKDGSFSAHNSGTYKGDKEKTFAEYDAKGEESASYIAMNSSWVNTNPSCPTCIEEGKSKVSNIGSEGVSASQKNQVSNQHSNGDPLVSQEVQYANTGVGIAADAAEHLNQYKPKYASSGVHTPPNGPPPSKTFTNITKGVGFVSAVASTVFAWDRASSSSGTEAAIFYTTGGLHAIGGALQLFPVTAGVGLALDYIATGIEILYDWW